MEALKAQTEDERSLAQPRLAVVVSAQHYLLQIPALQEIQEENILAPFPLDVNPPNQWAQPFLCLSKRRKDAAVGDLDWASEVTGTSRRGHLSLILAPGPIPVLVALRGHVSRWEEESHPQA